MSGTNSRRAGIAFATIDGVPVDVASDLVYSVSTVKREMLIGQSGIQGYSEMPQTGYMSFAARDSAGIAVSSYVGKTASTVVVQLANGKTVCTSNAVCTEVGEVKSSDGTFNLKFESDDVSEQTV